MTTRADRQRWREVLAKTPTDMAPITIRARQLRGLLDALDAAETCHADCEERMQTAEARAMAAEGERDELAADLRATVERAEARGAEAEGQLAELRCEVGAAVRLARAATHPGHDGPCDTGLIHPADLAPPTPASPDVGRAP